MKYVEFMKKVVPLHDDCSTFSMQPCRVTKKWVNAASCLDVGDRFRIPMFATIATGTWTGGESDVCHAGHCYRRRVITTNLVDINLGIRILLGSSFYDGWEQGELFVKEDPLGNPVDRNHPWNQTTNRGRKSVILGQIYLGDVATLVRQRTSNIWRWTPAADRWLVSGPPRWRARSTWAM